MWRIVDQIIITLQISTQKTRKPRANEIQDEDYHFINNDKFKLMEIFLQCPANASSIELSTTS